MKLADRVKPISYMKSHAAEIIREFGEHDEPLWITQNGEIKAVMQSIASYEETQEAMALLKILALGSAQIEAGKVQPAAEAIQRLRNRGERS